MAPGGPMWRYLQNDYAGPDGEHVWLMMRNIPRFKTRFALGGTQINLNVMDKNNVLEAHRHPRKYPDVIVRVTGFSAYFDSLSPEFRQQAVDRIVSEG